jgi:NADH dehydrogenase FAD-containing subunit
MTDPGVTAPQIRSTDYVKNHDGTVTRYETWNVLWTAGVEAPSLARAVAKQTGLYAGRRVGQLARGQDFGKPFRYHHLGSAAYISRGKAIVSAFKMNFGGFPVRRQPGRFRGDCRAQRAR